LIQGDKSLNLYYSKNNPIYDFWCALVKPNAVTHDVTGKKLRFMDGMAQWGWMRDAEELYVRDCYAEAVQKLQDADMAMIEGTPGIGKSLFIFYYIYVVVSQSREKGDSIPTFLLSDSDGTKYFLRVDSNGNGVVHNPMTETPDYFITDTKGCSNPSFINQYIHVSSINNVNVKEVSKRMMVQQQRNGTKKSRCTIYLPGFSLHEYIEIDGAGETSKVSISILYTHHFSINVRHLLCRCPR
jgi:hypothetical protein